MAKPEYRLVCTKDRGVFFGELVDGELVDAHRRIVLRNARICVYWSPETHGLLGLAAVGPAAGSRVSPAVPGLTTLEDTTLVAEGTEKAAAAWAKEPWD